MSVQEELQHRSRGRRRLLDVGGGIVAATILGPLVRPAFLTFAPFISGELREAAAYDRLGLPIL